MSLVRVDRPEDTIAVVTLDDPDRRNAMSVAMGQALHGTFTALRDEEHLRAVVLTGAPPAFCAGGDLGMLRDYAHRARSEGFDATEAMRSFYRLFLAVRDLPVPVIAAVNGHAIGAGLCVAMACDLIVVAEDAKLGVNFAQLGLHPGMGATWLLPRLVGRQRAAELLYTGRLISGADAAAYGLALEARPAAEVLDRALMLARTVADAAPLVVRATKQALAATWDHTLEEQLDLEARAQARSYASEDLAEGLAALAERRPPRFSGR